MTHISVDMENSEFAPNESKITRITRDKLKIPWANLFGKIYKNVTKGYQRR